MATELFLRLISLNKDGAMYLGALRSIHLSCQPGPCCRLQLKWWQASKSRRSVSSEGSSELAHGLDSSVQSNQSHCRRSARLNFSRSKMLSPPKLRGACNVSKLHDIGRHSHCHTPSKGRNRRSYQAAFWPIWRGEKP